MGVDIAELEIAGDFQLDEAILLGASFLPVQRSRQESLTLPIQSTSQWL